MDIQELKQFESVYQPSKEIAYCWGVKKYVQLSLEEDHTDIADHANDSLRIWQAAKAQAVPEGYVLMPKEPTPKMIDATWDFDDEIQEMSHNTRNEFIYKTMIEAQEPAND